MASPPLANKHDYSVIMTTIKFCYFTQIDKFVIEVQ